jgi:hypothetical protein
MAGNDLQRWLAIILLVWLALVLISSFLSEAGGAIDLHFFYFFSGRDA